jgi:transcriptional regulator with XRE-family HTH domain
LLGARLLRCREAAGVTIEQVMTALDCGRTRVSTLESGESPLAKAELEKLLDLYGTPSDAPERRELDALRVEGKKRGWTAPFRLPKDLRQYVDLETDARLVRTFETETIPGLLQTPAYARRTHTLIKRIDPAQAERWTLVRLRRQLRLREAPLLELDAVISESALRRTEAESDLAAEQFDHLLGAARWPNVSLRVLPISAGLHGGLGGGFSVLEFDPEMNLYAAHEDSASGGRLSDAPSVVAGLGEMFADLRGAALSPEDSARFIAEVREGVKQN